MARMLFEEGVAGFAWWSTLEASWVNVTLFAERASVALVVLGEPEPLSIGMPLFRRTAQLLGVRLAR